VARSRGFPQRGQRRSTGWFVGPQSAASGASIAISSSVSVLGLGGSTPIVDGLTLIRTRGDLNVFLTSAAALGDGFSGAFGIGIANESAFTAGAASVLMPLAEEDWDGWIYHRYFSLFSGGPIAAATAAQEALQVNATAAAVHIEVDSKAMRKFTEEDVMYCAVDVVEVGTGSMEWAFNSRILVKLP